MTRFMKSVAVRSVLFSLLCTGVAWAEDVADKPAVEGPEGKQAFDDLARYYASDRHGDSLPPFQLAVRRLDSSPFAAERAQQARYLVALAAQSLADESNGRTKWQPSFAWGGGMESRARELRGWLAYTVSRQTKSAEALDVAVWLIEHDPLVQNQNLGATILCRIDAPKMEDVFRRLLAGPHPNPSVLVPILEQVSRRKLVNLAPEVRHLAGHYRLAVRTAAQHAAAELGITDVPPYRPEEAFPPVLDRMLKDIAAMVEVDVPPKTPWKKFSVTRPAWNESGESHVESLAGWLLGETADTLDVLPMTGARTRLPKKLAKTEPSSLQEAAALLLEIRNKSQGDPQHPAAGRFSRMGGLTSQFEPQFISVQEALVSAWLYQQGDKQTAAALFFPRIDASSDDRSLLDSIRDLLGNVYHLEMLSAYADAWDYGRALELARHLCRPVFHGYWYQDRAKELAEQLSRRSDDFKTFRLPRPDEWVAMKKKLTRTQQIEFLATHLRLLKGFQWGQPGGVTYDVPQHEQANPEDAQKGLAINPYEELCGMDLEIAEIPVLAPFLTDRTFTLTYGYWRDFHPARDLHRVNRVVAAIINHAAHRDLIRSDAFSENDEQGQRKQRDEILQWCRQNAGKTRQETWFSMLADDKATSSQWGEAGRKIVEPGRANQAADRSNAEGAMWNNGRLHVAENDGNLGRPLAGDSLRSKKDPSLTELLGKRSDEAATLAKVQYPNGGEMEIACELALCLAKWDPNAAVPVVRRRFVDGRYHARAGSGYGNQMLQRMARWLAPLAEAGVQAGDDATIHEYIAWLRATPASDFSFFELSIFMPLWRHPDNPKLAELARWVFLADDSPWHPIQELKPLNSLEMINSPLVGVPAFRELLKREFANTSPIGHFTVGRETLSLEAMNSSMGSTSIYAPDVELPKSVEKQPLRACDFYAVEISRLEGAPRYELYWPENRRDAVRKEMAKFLDQWGDCYRDRSRSLNSLALHLHSTPPFRLSRLAQPATPEDVAAGRAIFSLGDKSGARVRVVPLDPYPNIARWKTLTQFRLREPGVMEWPEDPNTEDRKVWESLPKEPFDREGLIWQAEEIQLGGKWRRYYGFVGNHVIAQVPAEEIDILSRFSPSHPPRF